MTALADDGFDAFATAAMPELRRVGRLLTHSHTAADDLVQFALVQTLGAWPRLAGTGGERQFAYARRVMANANVSWWRRWASRVTVGPVPHLAVESDPFTAWAERDMLVRALARLTSRQRTVMVLRYYAGLSEAEIAEALGCRVGTVKSTASRALASLRHLLAERPADQGEEAPA